MAEYEKLVRKVLASHQCTFVRHGKGDHDIANEIMKQSGIDHRFR